SQRSVVGAKGEAVEWPRQQVRKGSVFPVSKVDDVNGVAPDSGYRLAVGGKHCQPASGIVGDFLGRRHVPDSDWPVRPDGYQSATIRCEPNGNLGRGAKQGQLSLFPVAHVRQPDGEIPRMRNNGLAVW